MVTAAQFLARLGRALTLVLITLGLTTGQPAAAQFSDSYNFLKAVRARDGTAATKLLNDETSRVINTRDSTTGETALIIVVKGRDSKWTSFLLAKGASPSVADRQGMTPLMHATLIGFGDAAELLLKRSAPVDQTNSRGETALILAVQRKDNAMIRLLIANKANPDKADHVAGMSARDYARRDDRTGSLLALLDQKQGTALPAAAIFGPK